MTEHRIDYGSLALDWVSDATGTKYAELTAKCICGARLRIRGPNFSEASRLLEEKAFAEHLTQANS